MSTKLSTKGQLIIPKSIRDRHGWSAGTELVVEDHATHVVLRSVPEVPETRLDDLVGCTGYTGPRRSLEEMEEGIARARAKMISLDTNVLVRVVTRDDPDQLSVALELMRKHRLFVSKTVLLELEWVLRYTYELSPAKVLDTFRTILGYPRLRIEDRDVVLTALEGYAHGFRGCAPSGVELHLRRFRHL